MAAHEQTYENVHLQKYSPMSEGEYIKIIVSMGSAVLFSHYSDFPADHIDFSVYLKKKWRHKRTLLTLWMGYAEA